MPLANTPHRYGTVAKVLHWLLALLILANIALGFLADWLPYETQEALQRKAAVFSIHKTLGIAILAVALVRVVWALVQTRPRPMHPERLFETFLAEAVHWSLYAALVIVPLSGWVQHAASEGFAPILWPLGQSLPLVPASEAVELVAGATHWLFGWILIGAVVLHVLGALKHAFERDGTLARMWFSRRAIRVPGGHAGTAGPAAMMAAAIYVAGGIAVVWLSAEAAPEREAVAIEEQVAVAGDWAVESGSVEIAVAQFGSSVTGSFSQWQADITFDETVESGEAGAVRVEIAIPSLTLGSVTEQAMVPDYFDAEAHPAAVFDAIIEAGEGGYVARGTLDLAGQEAEVVLPFTLEIEGERAVMAGSTTLDRRDFAIGEGTTDPGTLGFEVEVAIALTATRAE